MTKASMKQQLGLSTNYSLQARHGRQQQFDSSASYNHAEERRVNPRAGKFREDLPLYQAKLEQKLSLKDYKWRNFTNST